MIQESIFRQFLLNPSAYFEILNALALENTQKSGEIAQTQ